MGSFGQLTALESFGQLTALEDREIVLVAVKQNAVALESAATELKEGREISFEAVKQNASALESAPGESKADREIVFEATNRIDGPGNRARDRKAGHFGARVRCRRAEGEQQDRARGLKEEQRARDLFYALWVPDLFMQRVKNDQDWTFFCPDEAYDVETEKGLIDLQGEEFEALYTRLEAEGEDRKTVKAQQLWFRGLESLHRDGHAVPAVQGPLQPEVKSTEPRDDPLLQSLHGDLRVHLARGDRGLQPGFHRSAIFRA